MSSIDGHGNNFALRDEIKAYWSSRAATFDLSPGHEIFSDEERAAWHALILKHLGPGNGRVALDLACGTGVISHLMDDLGFAVTGLDWSETMLSLARSKAISRGRLIHFSMADAENTMEPDGTYDVIITRHLVWTLVDPKASLAALLEKAGISNPGTPHAPGHSASTHNSILSRVYFSNGARADAVATLLKDTGFQSLTVDANLKKIHKAQTKDLGFFKATARGLQHRYAILATKPDV
jgi:SAM-dependent methyltransferase